MLIVANRLPVASGREEEFVELFEERLEEIREQAGFERVELLAPAEWEGEQDCYVIQAYWASREDFERWRDSDAFRRAHADFPSELFAGSNRIEIYELTAEFDGE